MDRYISQEALLFFFTARKNDEFLKTTNPSPPTLCTGHHKLLFSLWDCRAKPPKVLHRVSKQE
jgi:hypothetical protein